ncbi:TetR/AcrR family transcriptional regulator [Roseobacter sp. YSTF-M11]|uniref:TetR/AcrR family transcriptional regulator n=1 Tax=Roseobacter insulae TaxID=2859783 RepID=A0A9X1FRC4_9RHOB|nr:TetR/AcrR family transcriptional regulator [Roseobacter insulae]MBW4706359.1 TetR/AcrR family transcriptional regulator [Roseobacter insulae]
MVGVKTFDTEEALTTIMEVFREKGYAGTSLGDLEKATGLPRTSLYNAYGNKNALYDAAIRLHRVKLGYPLLAELKHPDIRVALRNMLFKQIEGLSQQDKPVGCLVTNSCADLGALSSDLDDTVREMMEEFEDALKSRFTIALASGDLDPNTDVVSMARYFLSISRVIPLMYRASGDLSYVKQVAETALSVLR